MQKKRSFFTRKRVCKWIIIMVICVWAVFSFSRKYPMERTIFSSFEEFCEAGARCEMDYLERNYMDMDYKEILSMSQHGRGFKNAYGSTVEAHLGDDYSLDDFPVAGPFEEVIPDDIRDYTILYFYPTGTGSVSKGILVNESTHRFVVYYFGSIR